MVRIASALSDKLLGLFLPRADAFAACSGGYYVCASSGCAGVHPFLWYCQYKPNCTDSCYRVQGTCC